MPYLDPDAGAAREALADLGAEGALLTGLTATAAELNLVDGSIAGTAVASKAAVLGATKNLDTLVLPVAGLMIGAGAGTAVGATAAELNLIDGSIAGTAVASKAAVLGADKNLDVLAIADGGLALGAGAGTAVTATAAELNLIDGSIAGTAVASKAAILGADKNLDILALPVSGLKIGAGAGTAVARTAAELNLIAQGVAAGYKVARGVHVQVAASDTIVTGLATVVACIVGFDSAPTVKQLFCAGQIGNQSGAPAAGSIMVLTFKPTAVNDVTPTAATDFTDNLALAWVALGT